MEIRFIGSGDAFGSGGRLQPCILVTDKEHCFALDFGLTALIGLRQQGIDPNTIDTVLLSHLHGDHCGGLPFLLMDAMLASKREKPLSIIGPEGTESHIGKLHEMLFPGSHIMKPKFTVEYTEINPGQSIQYGKYKISAVEAQHTEASNPLAVRLESESKILAYTGDGALTEDLINLTDGADLVIAECYFFDKNIEWHLNYPDIQHLKAGKTVLTHMHENMLIHKDEVAEACAYDGFVISL